MILPRRAAGGLILAGALILGAPAALFAQGEHGRRAGAELLVLAGDVAELDRREAAGRHLEGLRARVEGGLSGLPLLLRFADEERKRLPVPLDGGELRTLLSRGDYGGLRRRFSQLSAAYPLDSSGFMGTVPSQALSRRAAETHRTLCAPCHDHPYLETERPARNLFDQAGAMPYEEFLARMLVGVRGGRITAVENPFTDREMAALIAHYRSAGDAAPGGGRGRQTD